MPPPVHDAAIQGRGNIPAVENIPLQDLSQNIETVQENLEELTHEIGTTNTCTNLSVNYTLLKRIKGTRLCNDFQ